MAAARHGGFILGVYRNQRRRERGHVLGPVVDPVSNLPK
jgi:hypothetical protein